MKFAALILISAASLALARAGASAQESGTTKQLRPTSFDESGKTSVDGDTVSYLIRRLPLDSFPDLPEPIAVALNQRGCLIPQTYQAHHPENVIHASLDHPGSSDWAVLCSAHGKVDLLVFFARNGGKPVTLTSAPEIDRLERHDSSGVFGFDWGIDPATPDQVREAQADMEHHPAKLDHDALAESILNRKTVYHFYAHNAWTTVDVSD
jgi:hypothetical protein